MKKVICLITIISMLCIYPSALADAPNSGVNIAGSISVSSSDPSAAFAADGDMSTLWQGSTALTYDFGKCYPVQSVSFSGSGLENAEVLLSCDESFLYDTQEKAYELISKDKPITSLAYGQGGYLSKTAEAVDGNNATAFKTVVPWRDALTIDLGKKSDIAYVSLNTYTRDYSNGFKVFISDNADFTVSTELVKDGDKYVSTQAEQSAGRYVRMQGIDTGDASNSAVAFIYEFSVFEETKAVVPTVKMTEDNGVYTIDSAKAFRYMRLMPTGMCTVSETEIIVPGERVSTVNVAEGKTVTAANGSTIPFPSLPPSKMTDGSINTFGAINNANPYVDVDLGDMYSLSNIELYLRRDANTDRSDVCVMLADNPDFYGGITVAKQGKIDIIPQRSVYNCEVNSNDKKYRYVRVYEGGSTAFMVVAEIKAFAYVKTENTYNSEKERIYGSVTVSENDVFAPRISDGDIKSPWDGSYAVIDLQRCYPISNIEITGKGTASVYAANSSDFSDAKEWQVNCNGVNISAGNGFYRYIKISGNAIVLNEVAVYSYTKAVKLTDMADSVICTQGEGYVQYDMGKDCLLHNIDLTVEENESILITASKTADFAASKVIYEGEQHSNSITTGFADKLYGAYSCRYIRVYGSTASNLKIMCVAPPEIRKYGGNAVLSFDKSMLTGGENYVIAALYDNKGALIGSNGITTDGTETELELPSNQFSNVKLFVWKNIDIAQPLAPCAIAEQKWDNRVYAEVYVSKTGTDGGSGSESAPVRTIEQAQQIARQYLSDMDGNVIVHIGAGTYHIENPLTFTNDDSGRNGYKMIYKGEKGAVVSGAKEISGFTKGENGIYSVYLPNEESVYSLEVNGEPACLARTEQKLRLSELFALDGNYTSDGFYIDNMSAFENAEDVIIQSTVTWEAVLLKVKSITNENGRAKFTMEQPWFNKAATLMAEWKFDSSTDFDIVNAYELMDTPGEFYFNKKTKMLYYIPRDGEIITNAEIGSTAELMNISGSGVANHIKDLEISGIEFKNSSYKTFFDYGLLLGQAIRTVSAHYPGNIIEAAINIDYADNISITDCEIANTQQASISLGEGVINSYIANNVIHDSGDAAIIVGRPWHADIEKLSNYNVSTLRSDCFIEKPVFASSGLPHYLWDSKSESIINPNTEAWNPWVASARDAEQGIKSWVMIDLLKQYSIDSVQLISKTANLKNFKVIVSNDRNFEEYSTLGTQGSGLTSGFSSGSSGGNKYRYIKVIKTVAEAFSIGEIKVWTKDEPLVQKEELTVGNKIYNNYIYNTGLINYGAPALTACYTDSLTISHNTFENSAYSAISLGWGWQNTPNSKTCRNNTVEANKFYLYNQRCGDGGAVYTLGPQPGTVIKENYVIQNEQPKNIFYDNVLYPDEGSKHMVFADNVVDVLPSDNRKVVNIYTKAIENVIMHDTYSNNSTMVNLTTSCTVEPFIMIDISNPPQRAAEIMENAGARLD